MREKKKSKRKKHSSSYFLMIGTVLLIILLMASMVIYQRIIGQSAELLSDAENTYSYHFVLIADTTDSDFWQTAYQAMQKQANEMDAYVELQTGDQSNGYSLSDLMDISIAEKVDGIMVENVEEEGLEDKINEAIADGIPVVTVLNDAPKTERISFVGPNPYTIADNYAQELTTAILGDTTVGDDVNIAVILTEDGIDRDQYQIFSQINTDLVTNTALMRNITVNAVRVKSDEAFSYEEDIRELFRTSQTPNYIVCLNSIITDSAYQIVIDYNAAGKTKILGGFRSATTIQALDSGIVIATQLPDAEALGQDAVTALVDYVTTGRTNAYYGVETNIYRNGDLADEE